MSLDQIYNRSPVWAQTLFLNVYALGVRWHRYGRSCRRDLDRLLTQQHWSRDRLDGFRDQKIQEIVSHAFRWSPYYREIMRKAGLEPSDVQCAADLRKLPLLEKETIRARDGDLLTRERPAPTWHHGHTSGTTGSPLSLWYDRHTCLVTNAVDWRQKAWGGKDPDDWIGLLLGRVIVPPGQDEPPFWRTDYVQRQVWFSAFHMDEDRLGRYVQEIRRRGLRFLEGYPSTLFILANYLTREGVELPMEAVFTSSETLHDIQREAIEAAFDCPIFDFYGLAERVIFAAECEEHEGKHLAEEYGYAELVDDDGNPVPDGEMGYLVGTSLHNKAMPLIRYRTGDVSRILDEGPCACGRESRRIADVTTKAEDIVVTPGGRMISPSVLTHPFKPFDQILRSQIVQEEQDRLRVRIVPSAEFSEAHEAELVAGLQDRLGADMRIQVERVEEIPPETSGKFRWVISKVVHDYRFEW